MGWLADETGLDKCEANYVPLTPLSHLRRAASVFSHHTAIVYQDRRLTYSEYYARCSQLAAALVAINVRKGDVVATILPNIPAQAEAHFGIPACGAIINTINTRLDPNTVSYILKHGEAKVLLVDTAFIELTENAIKMLERPPQIIEVSDPNSGLEPTGQYLTYEDFLQTRDPNFEWVMPTDEWESLALNYTSGTTGRPKGVVYHHRGAYLMTMGTVISWRLVMRPVYLTIVPLFHCNGWNHTWMIPLLGGTLVCCRDITASAIFDAISGEGVTHLGAAPIVLNTLVNSSPHERKEFAHTVEVFTAGAPPAPSTLAQIESLGFNVTHVYGLTETYGHITECLWDQNRWGDCSADERAALKARQGIAFPMMEDITVMDASMQQVPMDQTAQGEIVVRGNAVMKGYYKNPKATLESFKGGYFHSEDIAVQCPDTYIQIMDRAKDIIISGGENISSVEVENALMAHPAILHVAVVAMPDPKWGEVPCAVVELKENTQLDEHALIDFARKTLAGFKIPKKVLFRELPKTSTGKIQKFELREIVSASSA
ncbi:MAG: AMP-binding protein [Aestuariivita sp.]|nr:AMP-binding protein [Aestuariivita sp.]MCY4202491.1 AMP-binding protein [Aestuariivita sp.]